MTEHYLGNESDHVMRGADIVEALEGHNPYFSPDPAATYREVPLSPDQAYVVGSHFGQQSHVVEGRAAEVIMAIGRGVGGGGPMHAVLLTPDFPPRAIVYERVEP